MKNILLATTALVLSAGLAHAQAVTITGEGRMGLMYTSGGAGWSTENRLTLNFNVAVQADHGLSFGAWTRARMSGRGGTAVVTPGPDGLPGTADDEVGRVNGFSGSRVWVEASGLRLTFGNVDGAFRGTGVAFGYLGGCGVGYEGGQQCGDAMGLLPITQGQNSTGVISAQRVRVDYTMGSTRVSISNDNGTATDATEIGVRTTFDAWTVAAGYSTGPFGVDFYSVSAAYNGGSWSAGAAVAADGVVTNYVLQASANLGGGRLYGYVGEVNTLRSYGLNYGYGLGGGATLSIGAERVGAVTTASVGVAFNF